MDESTARSRHPDSLGHAFLWALVPSLALFLIAPAVSLAQVATNITPSALPACPGPCGPGVTIVAPPFTGGTVTTITGGARPGNGPNLFHSFGQFNVGTGDIANFFNETSLPTSNILSRVTGGNPSQIYGTIQTTDFPGANLFLMNPAGVLFGPSAALDLGAVTGSAVRQPGSFYATTADYLNLADADGTSPFYADPAKASVLSVAPVAAFGFTASSPVSITLEGSTLMVGEGQTLSIAGGNKPFNKTIQEGPVLVEQPVPSGVTMTGGTLSAPGGQINLVSVASPGEVLVPSLQTGPNNNGASFTSFGSVSLALGSNVNVSGASTISIRGGQIVLSVNDAVLTTLTTSQPPGLPETISLSPGSSIVTLNSGTGPGADVQLIASNVQMDGAFITTQTSGRGSGGDILITSGAVQLGTGASINSSTSNDFEAGAGGDISLNVSRLTLTDFASIQSASATSSPKFGQGGNVTIQGLQGAGFAAESVGLSSDSFLLSQTFGSGDGGELAITSKSLAMGGFATMSASTFGDGRGGDIVVSVEQASLSGGATITSQTVLADPTAAPGGTVTVQGLTGDESKADSLTLTGGGSGITSIASGEGRLGDIEVHAKTVSLTDGAVIQAGSPRDPGTAGNVTIDADSVGISGGSRISSLAFAADAGQVAITADQLTLDNGSIVTDTRFLGRGGDVVLDVGSISLSNGATISSSSSGTEPNTGDAGNVTITSSGAFTSNSSEITTSAENARGGNIDVTAESVALSNGTVISASSTSPLLPDGEGDAGNITIHSESTVVMNNLSEVTTEADLASGGQIEINAPEMVRLTNSRISTSVKGVAGDSDGGNITIDPQFVILQNSQIIAQANAGAGGAINVTAGVFLADPTSVVSASSQSGPQGTVNIQSPVQNLGEQLTPLSQQFSSAAALLAQRCAARVADGKFSTFVVAGREGLPVEPGGFLTSPSFTAELLGASLSGLYPHTAIAAVTGSFPEYDAKPIHLAKFGDACR